MDLHFRHLLRMFRSVMPGVAGVVLTNEHGASLAADVAPDVDAHHLASKGRAAMEKGTSALVNHRGLLYLVVLMPSAS